MVHWLNDDIRNKNSEHFFESDFSLVSVWKEMSCDVTRVMTQYSLLWRNTQIDKCIFNNVSTRNLKDMYPIVSNQKQPDMYLYNYISTQRVIHVCGCVPIKVILSSIICFFLLFINLVSFDIREA